MKLFIVMVLFYVVFIWCSQSTVVSSSISISASASSSSSDEDGATPSPTVTGATLSPSVTAVTASPSASDADATTCSLTGSLYTGGVLSDRLAWIALDATGTPIRVDILFDTIKGTPSGDIDAATFFMTNRIESATIGTGDSDTGYILTVPTSGTGTRWILRGDVEQWIENAGQSQANTEAELEVVGALPTTVHEVGQMISDCNQELLIIDDDNEVYEVGVGSVDSDLVFDEIRIVANLPGIELAETVSVTYNSVSGQIMVMTNNDGMSLLTQWTLGCPSTAGMSWLVTPSGLCGDGDITNLEFAGVADAASNPFGLDGPVFNIACTTGAGSAGNPNPAFISFTDGVLGVLPDSVALASGLVPDTGFITGQIALAPGNMEGCEVPDDADCVDTSELDVCM